jgi:preprotein translocase subunit SecF
MWGYTFLVKGGFNFGIDFKPGLISTIKISAKDATQAEINKVLSGMNAGVQNVGKDIDHTFTIRVSESGDSTDFQAVTENRITELLSARFGVGSVTILSTEFIGSRMAGTIRWGTILFTSIALLLIFVYVWIRFHIDFSIAAILALVHDSLFTLGFIGALQLEFDTAIIAAVLTIIGYSINDTIVVYDRIRENQHIVKDKSFGDLIDFSVTQTLSRTMITSATTVLAIVAVFILGQGSVRNFALTLIIGILVGTYSSVFIASSLVLEWNNIKNSKLHGKLEAARSVKKERVR